MEVLTFIAELVRALAWPSTITILVFMLRKPIRDLIPLVTRLKYKDLELEFGQRMAEVRVEVVNELPPQRAITAAKGPKEETLIELAIRSPHAAIAKAWEQLEIAARLAAHRKRLFSAGDITTTTRAILALERHNVIDAGKAALLHDLRALRDQVVHSPRFAVSTEDALDYVQFTERMVDYLEASHEPDTTGWPSAKTLMARRRTST